MLYLQVAGVVGRADVLAGVLYTAAIMAYYKSATARKSAGSYIAM